MDKLIVGCGYLGSRVARLWLDAGHRVWATTRSPERAGRFSAQGIQPVVCDVMHPDSLKALPPAETVLYAVGFDRSSGQSMRQVYVTGLGNVLRRLERNPGPVARFIHVSSTGVYGQTDGAWVDETAATEPASESGRIVLDAEQLLRTYHETRPNVVIMRFAGIYGPGRLLRRQEALQAGTPLEGSGSQWLNLVHVADGATAVDAADRYGFPGAIYNVCDDAPVVRGDYFGHLAELVGAPTPRFDGSGSERGNRRIANGKLKALGWAPVYETFRQGLPTCLVNREET